MLGTHKPLDSRARGSGLFRTVVVAVATLTVVLLGFSIYQSTQQPPPSAGLKPAIGAYKLSPAPTGAPSAPSGKGVEIAPNVRIGSGTGPVLSIYPPQGAEAVAEVETASWFPVDETGNELKLVSPLIRLRTKAGQRVNIRSDEGLIQINALTTARGRRQEWQRGRLMGRVVVDIDRLSDVERNALPPEQRDVLTPDRLIRIMVDQIEFDLEYNHVRVDGAFSVVAREVELDAVGLDMQLDASGGRIEALRVQQGRRLVVRAPAENLSLMVGGQTSETTQSTSWLDVIRAGPSVVDAPATPTLADKTPPEGEKAAGLRPGMLDDEGALIIGPLSTTSRPRTHERTTYEARIEGDVIVVHERGQEQLGRLEASVLNILKDVSSADRSMVASPSSSPASGAITPGEEPLDTLTLTWTGPLTLTTLPPEDVAATAEDRLEIRAQGAPVRVSDVTGQASCSSLVFIRQHREIHLDGNGVAPVVLDNLRDGAIHAIAMRSTESEGRRHVVFTGPGRLLTTAAEPARSPGMESTPSGGDAGVLFQERMELEMTRVTRKTLDLRQLRTVTRESMAPANARFFGQVRMHDGERRIDADHMVLDFQPEADGLRIKAMSADGHVEARLDEGLGSLIECRRLEVDFNTARPRVTPSQARAFGDVVARHDGGVMSADDRMVFDFVVQTRVRRGRLDPLETYLKARLAGEAPEDIDWAARRRDAESVADTIEHVRLSRILALENVMARDDRRKLHLRARRLDCTLDEQQQIDVVMVEGEPANDAHVQLGAMTIRAATIRAVASTQDVSVPTAGSLVFLSQRDLDGRPLKTPAPIHLRWSQSMAFNGRENHAIFTGAVHAESERHSFDAARVEVGFVDAPSAERDARRDWWILADLMNRTSSSGDSSTTGRFEKEAVFLSAAGNVAAVMARLDEQTGAILSRARLTGESLVVDRRTAPGNMRIVGAGTLLMEDYEARDAAPREQGTGLLAIGAGSDRSQTGVTWTGGMNYDFEKQRATFTDNVNLRHLSGRYLVLQDQLVPQASTSDDGRATSLSCQTLTVDFASSDDSSSSASPPADGPGDMDARRIRQFRATGNVAVTDPKFTLDAEDVVYNRASQQLLIEGTDTDHAEAFQLRPGELPRRLRARRLSLDLLTGTFMIVEPVGEGS